MRIKLLLLAFLVCGLPQLVDAQNITSVDLGKRTDGVCSGAGPCTLIGLDRYLINVIKDVYDAANHRLNFAIANGSCTVANEAATETAGCANTAGVSAWLKAYGKAGSSTWDRVSYGQAPMASSLPFALASNQPPVPGTLKSGAITSAMTGTTSTVAIAGQASNYLYVTHCTTSNASTTVSTDILLQDGNGGTTLYVLPAPAAAVATTGGGGGSFSFPAPIKVPTLGNALYVANVTTGSSTKVSCSGYYSTASY